MDTISKKLIFTIIAVLIAVNAINISIHSQIAKKNFISIHDDMLDRLFLRLQLTLSNPIWNMQTNMVKDIIFTEGLDSSIDEITILDEDKQIISQYMSKNTKKTETGVKSLDIVHEKQKIASVIIKYNRNEVNELISKKVKAMIFEAFVIIFLLSVIIKFTIDSIISKKLLTLTSNIKKFKQTNEINTTTIDGNDEISYLSKEFNNMQQELKQNWDNLNQINKTLETRVKDEVAKNREKEKQIFEQSKLAQMGEMIGNIAHQWRQPLSYISTAASSLSLQKELGSLSDEMFQERTQGIVNKTQYLSKTIDTFRNFIQTDKKIGKILINDALSDALEIILKTLENEEIKVIQELNEKEYYYLGYKGELSQVFLNIFNNAKDAFINKDIENKTIIIKIEQSNDIITITIMDNAGGIDKEILPKVFDPYFTTKHKSQGTGIGLYMCKDIIENHHGGKLNVENTIDGAKFIITLPIDKEKD